MLTRKEFERQYSAELLPSSFGNYAIGDIWDWEGFILNRQLKCENSNIAEVCSDIDLLKILQGIPMQPAMLPDIDITSDFKSDVSLSIPSLGLSLSDVLTADKVDSFSFSSVQGKNAIGYNSLMTTALDNLKTTNFNVYTKQIRGNQIVMSLFYATSVNITISKTGTNQAAITAKIQSIPGITLNVDTSDANTIKYTINNSNCPFAAQFESGRDI